jgi:hypothetical protein
VGLSLMLIRVNRKHGYGLEKPNIKESK